MRNASTCFQHVCFCLFCLLGNWSGSPVRSLPGWSAESCSHSAPNVQNLFVPFSERSKEMLLLCAAIIYCCLHCFQCYSYTTNNKLTDGIAQSWSFNLAVCISTARCHQILHPGLNLNYKSTIFPALFLVSASPHLVPPVIHVNYAGSWAGCQKAWRHWQAIRQNRAGWQMARSGTVSCAV